MSIRLMTEAWGSNLPTGTKMVLLSLCDSANDHGECYPSISALAAKCSMSERSVFEHLKKMEKMGAVERVNRLGRSTLYRLDPCRFCTPAESAPLQNLHPTPAESAPPPAESAPPTPAESAPITIIEPLLNHQMNHTAAQKRGELAGKIFKIDDVDGQVVQDFIALRKAAKAPLTATAVRDLREEASKAGLTLEQVLRMCCARGWRGFKAAWLQDRGGRGRGVDAPAAPKSFAQQDREAGWARWEEMTGREHPDRLAADAANAAAQGRTCVVIDAPSRRVDLLAGGVQ